MNSGGGSLNSAQTEWSYSVTPVYMTVYPKHIWSPPEKGWVEVPTNIFNTVWTPSVPIWIKIEGYITFSVDSYSQVKVPYSTIFHTYSSSEKDVTVGTKIHTAFGYLIIGQTDGSSGISLRFYSSSGEDITHTVTVNDFCILNFQYLN